MRRPVSRTSSARRSVGRRTATAALVAVLFLTGCTQQYETPDDRSHAFGADVSETIRQLDPLPTHLRVRGGFGGIVIEAYLDRMSYDEVRRFVEGALAAVDDSPLGSLPVRLMLSHESAQPDSGTLEWRGYDPARAERYFGAVQLWLDALADPGVRVEEWFSVRAADVTGTISVLDGRDVDAYRAELVGALELAGFPSPSLSVVAAPTQ